MQVHGLTVFLLTLSLPGTKFPIFNGNARELLVSTEI